MLLNNKMISCVEQKSDLQGWMKGTVSKLQFERPCVTIADGDQKIEKFALFC
jgi:hypothetical protein